MNYKSLVKQLTFRKYNRGEIIFKEAEPCDFFYIALSGKLVLLLPKTADQMAKEIKQIQSRNHLISKTKAFMRVQSAFAPGKKDNASPKQKNAAANNDNFSSQPQLHKSTFKSKATSILKIQTAFASNKKDFAGNPATPSLAYLRNNEKEMKTPLTAFQRGKEIGTNFFSTPFQKSKQDTNEGLSFKKTIRSDINPFSQSTYPNATLNFNAIGSPGLNSTGAKKINAPLNIAGLGEEELGGSFFQEGVCKYILIKFLKKAGKLN